MINSLTALFLPDECCFSQVTHTASQTEPLIYIKYDKRDDQKSQRTKEGEVNDQGITLLEGNILAIAA